MVNWNQVTEDKARELGEDRKRLERRLREARAMLVVGLKAGFGRGTFNFRAKTLSGDNGVVLQWSVREYEDEPESYLNQQTTTGHVAVYAPREVVEKHNALLRGIG